MPAPIITQELYDTPDDLPAEGTGPLGSGKFQVNRCGGDVAVYPEAVGLGRRVGDSRYMSDRQWL
jgi:hypothetical protein